MEKNNRTGRWWGGRYIHQITVSDAVERVASRAHLGVDLVATTDGCVVKRGVDGGVIPRVLRGCKWVPTAFCYLGCGADK